jgi:hypothetical protein
VLTLRITYRLGTASAPLGASQFLSPQVSL